MHPLLVRLTGKSALKNWSAHLADIETDLSRFHTAVAPAATHAARLAKTVADFDLNPSPERCQAVIDLKIQTDAAFFIEQHVRDQILERRNAGLFAGRAKFEAAVTEVRHELERRQVEIREDDAKRSADLGSPVNSEAALVLIERKLESLDGALAWFANDPVRAIGAFQTVLG